MGVGPGLFAEFGIGRSGAPGSGWGSILVPPSLARAWGGAATAQHLAVQAVPLREPCYGGALPSVHDGSRTPVRARRRRAHAMMDGGAGRTRDGQVPRSSTTRLRGGSRAARPSSCLAGYGRMLPVAAANPHRPPKDVCSYGAAHCSDERHPGASQEAPSLGPLAPMR